MENVSLWLDLHGADILKETALKKIVNRFNLNIEKAISQYDKWRKSYVALSETERTKIIPGGHICTRQKKLEIEELATYNTIYHYYVERQQSADWIAKKLGISLTIVYRKLAEYNIPLRKKRFSDKELSFDILYDMRVNKNMRYSEMSRIFKCDPKVIKRRLEKYNIA